MRRRGWNLSTALKLGQYTSSTMVFNPWSKELKGCSEVFRQAFHSPLSNFLAMCRFRGVLAWFKWGIWSVLCTNWACSPAYAPESFAICWDFHSRHTAFLSRQMYTEDVSAASQCQQYWRRWTNGWLSKRQLHNVYASLHPFNWKYVIFLYYIPLHDITDWYWWWEADMEPGVCLWRVEQNGMRDSEGTMQGKWKMKPPSIRPEWKPGSCTIHSYWWENSWFRRVFFC